MISATTLLHVVAHPSQVQGPASVFLVLVVARTDTAGVPFVVSPQLCSVSVPVALALERHLSTEGRERRSGSDGTCDDRIKHLQQLRGVG
jgi:hypothetical protein